MAAPAPVAPWLCFPVQAVLGEGGRVRGESSRFGVGFGVRWRGTQGLQVLRMERKAVPVSLTRSSLNLRKGVAQDQLGRVSTRAPTP